MTRILVIRPDGQTVAMDMGSAEGAAGHFCGGMVTRLPVRALVLPGGLERPGGMRGVPRNRHAGTLPRPRVS